MPEQAWAAAFFGAFSAFSCVLGAALGVAWRPPQRAVAGIMAFGAGALLSALSFELILTAQEKGGFTAVAVGAIIGGVAFVMLNEILNGHGGFLRKPATTARYVRTRKQEESRATLEKLSRVSLLTSLPPEDISAMVPHVETVGLTAGETLFRQGDEGDALYLIDEGQVDLLRDSGEQVGRLEEGEAFGEMALLTGERRAATAVAASDVSLLRIPKDDFDKLLAVSPSLADAVSGLLARNLAAVQAGSPAAEPQAEQWRKIAARYMGTHSLTSTEIRAVAQEHGGGAAKGIFLGLMLDGIPESLVIGMSMIGQPAVSATLIAGLFLSNFPEALSSAVGMKAQGSGVPRILGMWIFLMMFIGVGALIGNALFVDAPPGLIAAFEAAAAGAMLTMIAETALPEAYEQGGWLSGIATLLGFLAAFFVKTLSEGH